MTRLDQAEAVIALVSLALNGIFIGVIHVNMSVRH